MKPTSKFAIAGAVIAIVIALSLTSQSGFQSSHPVETSVDTLRIGYFPNINHAQAVIGLGKGDFQKTLGNVKIETQIFNAGPSAIEAVFANRIDVTYVGPNPAINGYIKSEGQDLRIIAGASSGGAVFVVRNDSGISRTQDFAGKKFASPQLGNTQDVALRAYLLKNGYKTSENGGNVQVIPAKNADIVTMMAKKDIDGAWVPEPWGVKLVKETNGKIFLDERNLWPDGKFVTALIVVRTDYLHSHPDVIKKLLEAHVDETIWINSNREEAIKIFNEQIIYNLVRSYTDWVEYQREHEESSLYNEIPPICKFQFMKDLVFRRSDPAVFGAEVLVGRLRQKMQVMNEEGRKIGMVHQVQESGKAIELATAGMQVAVSIKEPTIGRQINEGDIFYTDLNSKQAKQLLERFSHRLNESEKKVFNIILSLKRKNDPAFGYL